MIKHIKADSWSFLGMTMTTDYLNRVQIPLLLDVMGWSVAYIVSNFDSVEFPFTRHPKIVEYRTELHIAEQQRLEAAEKAAEEYRRMNPSPEELRRREDAKEAYRLSCLEQAARIRGARPTKSAYDVNYGGGINSQGDWD